MDENCPCKDCLCVPICRTIFPSHTNVRTVDLINTLLTELFKRCTIVRSYALYQDVYAESLNQTPGRAYDVLEAILGYRPIPFHKQREHETNS